MSDLDSSHHHTPAHSATAAGAALSPLQAACARVAQELSAAAVGALCAALQQAPPASLPPLAEYLLLPLRVLLSHPAAGQAEAEAALGAMQLLFARAGRLLPLPLATSHVALLALVIDSRSQHRKDDAPDAGAPSEPAAKNLPKLAPLSEEALCAAAAALNQLLRSGVFGLGSQLALQLPTLGHALTALLQLAERPSLGTAPARRQALVALQALVDVVAAADVTALVFPVPGVLSGLTRLACSDQTAHGALVSEALAAWARMAAATLGHIPRKGSKGKSDDDAVKQLQQMLDAAHAAENSNGKDGRRDTNNNDDDDDNEDDEPNISHLTDAEKKLREQYGKLRVKRSRQWWMETESQVAALFQRIASTVPHHRSPRPRAALALLCGSLLRHCHATLPSLVAPVLDTLALLSLDELPSIRAAAATALIQLHPRVAGEDNADEFFGDGDATQTHTARMTETAFRHRLAGLLLPVVHQRLLSLPRLCRLASDAELRLCLQRVQAAIVLLGPSARQLLQDPDTSRQLLSALVLVQELDLAQISFMVDVPAGNTSAGADHEAAAPPLRALRRVYKYFRDPHIETRVAALCRVWQQHGCVRDLINLTLEYHSPRNEPQAFLVLAAALSPKAASAPSDGTDLAQLLLQARETWEVCRPDVLPPSNVRRLRHWQQMMDASQALEAELQRGEGPVTAPVEEGAYNLGSDGAPTTDLMAGALQLLSALLQPEWWEHQVADHTSRSLVPTAEEADVQSARQQPPSSQRSRSRAFLTTCLWLETFAAVAQVMQQHFQRHLVDVMYLLALHLGSPTAAIAESARFALQHVAEASGCTSVADLLGRNADYIINDIGLKIKFLDLHPQAPYALRMLLAYADCSVLPALFDLAKDVFDALDGYNPDVVTTFLLILRDFATALSRWEPDLHSQAVRVAEQEAQRAKAAKAARMPPPKPETEYREEEPPEDASVPNDDEPPPPAYIELAVEIVKRCQHYVGDTTPLNRMLALDIIRHAVPVLAPYERHLLPTAHLIWFGVLQRLSDPVDYVATAAVQVLPVLCRACGTFFRHRVVTEACPALLQRIEQARKVDPSSYAARSQYGSSRRLQHSILQTLVDVWEPLKPDGQVVCKLAATCLPYLHSNAPEELARCASSLFHTLIKLDADVVWLTLARVVRPASLVHDVHLPAPDDGYAHYAAPLLALAEATGPVWAPLA